MPVVVDGVIAAAASLVATAFAPEVVGYLIVGHRSSEPGSSVVLEELGLSPVLDLGMRLGEGSGAALAVPTVQAAAKILREMATFDSAGVSDKADAAELTGTLLVAGTSSGAGKSTLVAGLCRWCAQERHLGGSLQGAEHVAQLLRHPRAARRSGVPRRRRPRRRASSPRRS